nr:deleted in malignant brain tumors 1 protein-like [Danio rerio]|eukprot:XP_021327210.1 deleted in malignant brain tumors 1 protein-like [Danio rerio]
MLILKNRILVTSAPVNSSGITTSRGPTEEQQVTTESYDDVIIVGLRPCGTEDYDDVIIVGQFSDDKAARAYLRLCGRDSCCSSEVCHNAVISDRKIVRLVGGQSRCAGRVEVYHDDQWGTVCGDFWDMADAAVVCRELDCGEPVDALDGAHFGPGSGPIWLGYVMCSGSESTLRNCGSLGWGKSRCSHGKEAGVICSDVRLVGGSRCSGRLEIRHNQTWMSVCDAAFDQQDAEVVCRELDCGAPVQVLRAAAFDKVDAQMWTQEIHCRGNESQIHLCPTSASVKSNCSHKYNIDLLCSDIINVRLVNGTSRCAGTVEVLHRGQWGTVCGAAWDLADAAVVCRELDCGEPVDALYVARFEPGSGLLSVKNVGCTGSESTLKKCGLIESPDLHVCLDKNAHVICSEVRLVGGSRCSGRLEILHDQTWMSVCDAAFDQQDAEVVCRELDCGAPVQVLRTAAFDKGDTQMWTQEIHCKGNESQVHLCPTSSPENSSSHENYVGLVCTDHSRVRLVGGHSRCAGRVEVFHRGQWGTVCDYFWDMLDAAVVCRELDCGEPLDALDGAYFGQGSVPVWTNIMVCTGSESTLKNCGSLIWGSYDCDYSKNAGVKCSGARLVGNSSCSGKVEILHNQTWMSVCDAAFDQQDAEVVCRELDCGAPVQVLRAAADNRDAQMWTQEIHCRGNESQIHLCPTTFHKNNCSHNDDQRLICGEKKSIKLVGGHSPCAGRVEVLHRGQWGTVCGVGWDLVDAAVVCRELDCGEPVDALGDAHFGPGSGQIWMNFVMCTGSESTLKNCGSIGWGLHSCTHSFDAGVICSGHKPSRLVNGFNLCSGRLEILHDQTWMSVCDAAFDQQDAEVVCRELDCGAPVQVLRAAAFGKGEAQMWTQEIHCRGDESHFQLCPPSPQKHNCTSYNNVGLVTQKPS